MFRVSREIHFCYGHRILNHGGKCRHLHGHNGKVVITFSSEQLNSLDMVVDFADIKDRVGTWIKENLDHCMLLSQDDPFVPILKEIGEPVFVLDSNPTAETIARVIFDVARSLGLPVTEVTLWETEECFATYTED